MPDHSPNPVAKRNLLDMNLHYIARSLALTAIIAVAVRWLQLHPWSAGIPNLFAVLPEWLILFFALGGLLFAPVLVPAELWTVAPRALRKPFLVDLAFIAAAYISFIIYARHG